MLEFDAADAGIIAHELPAAGTSSILSKLEINVFSDGEGNLKVLISSQRLIGEVLVIS